MRNLLDSEQLVILWILLLVCQTILSTYPERKGTLWDVHFPALSILKGIKDLSKPYVLDALSFSKKHAHFYTKMVNLIPDKKIEFMNQLYLGWSILVLVETLNNILVLTRSGKIRIHFRLELDSMKELASFIFMNFIARMSIPCWTVCLFPDNRIPEIICVTILGVVYALSDCFDHYAALHEEGGSTEVPFWGLVLALVVILVFTVFMYPYVYPRMC